MKKLVSIILSLALTCTYFILPASGTSKTKGKDLTVIFSHDMHSYIDTKEYYKDGKKVEEGGFAKIKTVIDDIKSKHDNTLTVDAGDFSMGTLFQSVFTRHAVELRMLGIMGYDATTLGNHEFDYGSEGVAKMIDSAVASKDPLPAMVNNNINWEKSTSKEAKMLKKSLDNYNFHEYVVVNKGDVKIAIFGGLGSEAIEFTPNSNLEFDSMVERSKETVKKIKEKENPDFIVCLSHSGINDDPKKSEDEILAKEVPDIDFIVSGHSHSTLENPIVVGNTIIGCVGEYGKNLGEIDLHQKKDGSWEIKNYGLIKIDDKIKPDKELSNKIEENRKYLDDYAKYFGYESSDQVIAYSPYDFNDVNTLYANHCDQAIGNLISDSFVYTIKQAEGEDYINVDASVMPVGTIRSNFYKGPITMSDVYEVVSLGVGEDGKSGYPLASVYLTGKELKTVAEVDASIEPLMGSAQLYVAGLQYQFNPNRLFLNKVTDVKLSTKNSKLEELDDKKLYRVVSNIYSAQMLGSINGMSKGLLSIVPKDKNGKEITDFTKHIIYDQQGREVKEWTALASYLTSFKKVDGIPTIPSQYEKAQNRKIVSVSKNVSDVLKKPNKIFFILLVITVVLIALIVLLIKFIVKKFKQKKQPKVKE